jgi:ABC-type polysaccharide/polyol phosphate transport system ATPase subunit
MSDAIISVENLSKKYLIGHRVGPQTRSRYLALRDVIGREVRNLARKTADLVHARQIVQGDAVAEFWAIRDVSFEVERGEVLGIIGRNGAGKSTLLKILSRITEPTRGRVTLRGRIASLLEVGTGFHPELTGRENIFLNGAILGMTRAEITRKFDEIVAFAEVETFLDTPVKHYSSGMYVRLAFAVAAHLEPEILVVDEVLAVGDAEFQKKCLGKMEQISKKEGRTVLLVSHNLDAISRLCRRGLLLHDGRILFLGTVAKAIEQYIGGTLGPSRPIEHFRDGRSSVDAELVTIWTATLEGQRRSTFAQGQPFQIGMTVRIRNRGNRDFALVIENRESRPLFTTTLSDCSPIQSFEGESTLVIDINNPPLRSGEYAVSLASFRPGTGSCYDLILHYPLFGIAGDHAAFPADHRWGDLYFPIQWRVEAQAKERVA